MEHSKNKAFIILSFLIFSFILSPAVMGEQGRTLLNGTGIFIESSQSWTFDQGYILSVKGVSEDTGGVWVELLLEGDVVKYDILYEGQSISYKNGEYEIFNITMDRIYYGPENDLITFRPVYQYFDPELPDDSDIVTDNSSGSESLPANNSSVTDDGAVSILPGFSAINLVFAIVILYRKLIDRV